MGEKYSFTYPKSSEVKIYSYTEVTEVSKNEAVMIHLAECALNGFPHKLLYNRVLVLVFVK